MELGYVCHYLYHLTVDRDTQEVGLEFQYGKFQLPCTLHSSFANVDERELIHLKGYDAIKLKSGPIKNLKDNRQTYKVSIAMFRQMLRDDGYLSTFTKSAIYEAMGSPAYFYAGYPSPATNTDPKLVEALNIIMANPDRVGELL